MGVDLNEAAANRPLTAADVDALLAGDVRALSQASSARVLVRRVRATLAAAEEQHRENRRDLVRALEGSKMSASPLSSAIAALGRLNSTEQRQVFAIAADTVVDRLREAVAIAHAARLAADNESRRARAVVESVLGDPEVPEHVKTRVRAYAAADPSSGSSGSALVLVDADADAVPAVQEVAEPFIVPAAATGLDDLFS